MVRVRTVWLVLVWAVGSLIGVYVNERSLLSVASLLGKMLLLYLMLFAFTTTGSLLVSFNTIGMLPGQPNFKHGPWAVWWPELFPRPQPSGSN